MRILTVSGILVLLVTVACLAWGLWRATKDEASPSRPLIQVSQVPYVRQADYLADQEAMSRRVTGLSTEFELLQARINGQIGALMKRDAKDTKQELRDQVFTAMRSHQAPQLALDAPPTRQRIRSKA